MEWNYVNEKLAQITDYPFQKLAKLLDGINPGGDVLFMSIGEPQHKAPALVGEALGKALHLWGKYPPVGASPEFKQAVKGWLDRRFGLNPALVQEKNIIPVAGTREALYMVAGLVVPEHKRGEKPVVLIPNPFYQVYAGAAIMAGAEPIFVTATVENGFMPDYKNLPEDILRRTVLAYICSPSNPQGGVASFQQMQEYLALAMKYNFVLASDECYSEIYGETPPVSALQVADSLDTAPLLVFHSLSKRSNVPGLRSGFVAGNSGLVDAFTRLRSYAGAVLPLPIVEASIALWNDEEHVKETRALYRAKFDMAKKELNITPPPASFYLWLEVENGEKAAQALWRAAGIRVLPGAYLARSDANGENPGDKFIRIALVHDLPTTEIALRTIAKVL